MTRVLGLKVGKVVLDAGHGGHDIDCGPRWVVRKDLVLDVTAIRALINRATKWYTCSDDTFIALETRPIAESAKRICFCRYSAIIFCHECFRWRRTI
jgi:N-acetylmuramoyl-L-alanine amidase